jgi:hypothetical protein
MSKWISIDDKLPEADVWVLISNIRLGGVDMGIYRDDEHLEADEHWQNEQGEPIDAYTGFPVTHWMQLPEPPTE